MGAWTSEFTPSGSELSRTLNSSTRTSRLQSQLRGRPEGGQWRFIPLALTLSVSFLPSPLSLPVWPLLPASSGDHAHQATLQTPLSTFQASLSFIPPLLSLLLIFLFPPRAHVASLHSAQTHVFRRSTEDVSKIPADASCSQSATLPDHWSPSRSGPNFPQCPWRGPSDSTNQKQLLWRDLVLCGQRSSQTSLPSAE